MEGKPSYVVFSVNTRGLYGLLLSREILRSAFVAKDTMRIRFIYHKVRASV